MDRYPVRYRFDLPNWHCDNFLSKLSLERMHKLPQLEVNEVFMILKGLGVNDVEMHGKPIPQLT